MTRNARRMYVLTILAIIYGFNGVDRLALGILLQNIKVDLGLTDTQLGFLTGIAFALFYALMGLPIARWADCGNRVTLIAVTTALWSTAVALCGLARSFTQLLLMRVCVAVGEAGCVPSALSLISDHFSRIERPRAVAIYLQGTFLSLVVGYFGAGWLNQLYGWRSTFVWLGTPGLLIALLAWVTLDEPRCSAENRSAVERASTPTLKMVGATLWANRTFRHLLVFYSVMCFFNYGLVQWQPAFLMRTYHMKTGELGTWTAVVTGLGLLIGTYLGGEWATRRAAHNERLQLRVTAAAYCASGILSALIYLSPNRYWAFAFIGLWNVAATFTNGPLYAMIQTLIPAPMRATAMTVVLLVANLIGMGMGPMAAGALSDALRPWAGMDSLRYALLALSPGYVWGGWHLWRASRTVMQDISSAHDEEQQFTGETHPSPVPARSYLGAK